MSTTESSALRALALPASFAVGVLLTVQSSINGELAGRLGTGLRSGLLAAVLSFGGGLLILAVILLATPAWRRDWRRLRTEVGRGGIPRWQLYGGLAGALFVASQGLTVGSIGVALLIVAVVAGQSLSALVVDHYGIGPAGRSPVTSPRLIGALLAVSAVVLSGGTALRAGGLATAALALLPFLAGAAMALQQAINAQVARVSSSWIATFNNFLIGTAALVASLALALIFAPGHIDGLPSAPWLYLGGPLGICFITLAAVVVRTLGVLLFGLTSICGQVITAIVIDLVVEPELVDTGTILGAIVALLGVAVAALGQSRATRRRTATVASRD